MPVTDVDVVVIGMGPGGESLAAQLARAGLSVVGVESRLVGGECPYYGCVPTKMMLRAAGALGEARRVSVLAGEALVEPDWAPVAARIRDEATDNWDDAVAVRRFTDSGGVFVRGRGHISAPGEVTVSTDVGPVGFRAGRAIVLNPGTDPAVPAIDGLDSSPYWTNREAVAVTEVPASLVVLGGGPSGCESAQVFARFGTRVTVVEALDRLLPAEEPEAGDLLGEVFDGEQIAVHTGATVTGVRHDEAGFTVQVSGTGGQVSGERLLVATGRRTDLAALGVAAVGLDPASRVIDVDGKMRAADGVWAIGDVTGHGAFTHMSMYQARIAAADILGKPAEPADYRAVPRVTFTDPEVAAVGLTEAAARADGWSVRTGGTSLASSSRGWIHKAGNAGLIKLVADADRDVLIGATAVGPAGGEILGALAVAVHAAVPIPRLRQMIYAYPTFHRAIETALDDLTANR